MARRLRIGTWNLLHGIDVRSGALDLDAAAAALAELRLDVVALQEVDRGLARSGGEDQTAVLAERLGMRGAFAPALLGDPDARWMAPGAADPGGAAYGVALLSRLPLLRSTRHRLPGGGDGQRRGAAAPDRPGWDREPRTALAVDLDAGGPGPLRVTTTHLSYLPWRAVVQLRAVRRLAAAEGAPAILAGDCNLPARAVRTVMGRPWLPAGGGPTHPAWRPRLQVDHIAVTGGVAVEAVEVGPPGPSDHLAVVAAVRLPDA